MTAPLRWFFILVFAMIAVWLAATWLAYYSPTSLDEASASVKEVKADGHEVKDREGEQAFAPEGPIGPAVPNESDDPPKREEAVRVVGTGPPAGSLEALVREAFPEDWERAFQIVTCESRWDPQARSATGDTGLFQINDIHRGSGGVAAGLSIADLMDPATNVAVARALYDQSGWRPWVCAW